MNQSSRGFIALTSVLIISVVLLMVVLGGSTRSFYARFNAFEREFKAQSTLNAETCIGYTQIRLIEDDAYEGDESLTLTRGSCDVSDMQSSGSTKTFSVSSEYMHAVTAIDVEFNTETQMLIQKEIHGESID